MLAFIPGQRRRGLQLTRRRCPSTNLLGRALAGGVLRHGEAEVISLSTTNSDLVPQHLLIVWHSLYHDWNIPASPRSELLETRLYKRLDQSDLGLFAVG